MHVAIMYFEKRKSYRLGGKWKINYIFDVFKTLDVIGKTAFGYDFNSLQNPDDPINLGFQSVLEGKYMK